jgi:molybdopterin molybdotransferase
MKKFINYNQSLDILNSLNISHTSTQKLFVSDTLDRILAKDIIAKENSPAYETSAMDGYAIQFDDLSTSKIKIIDKNPAGTVVDSTVSKGNCIKTFTGSLMPKGSDTLIPIENVTVEGEYIVINTPVPKGFSVRAIGENYKENEILIKKGTKIDFAHIGVMASLNVVQVEVFTKPIVAIASTGSEILDVGEEQTSIAQIRSSNHLTLEAIAKKYGADVHQMGVVEDDRESITTLLKNALKNSDIVVTTGGVSVGDYDYVKDIIKDELGCDVKFQGVNIKPGQHILFAKKDDKYIIGLPGFAYSSTVTFLLYVLPLIFKFKNSDESLKIINAIIDEDFNKKASKTIFTACNVNYVDGEYKVNFNGKKNGTSAILTNMLGNPGLLVQEEESLNISKGDKVKVILL